MQTVDKYVCIGCAKRIPEHETNSSLVTLKFGWRLRRGEDAKGGTKFEWRCPDCWQEYKARVAAASDDLTTDVSAVRPIPSSQAPQEKPATAWSWATPWRKSERKR